MEVFGRKRKNFLWFLKRLNVKSKHEEKSHHRKFYCYLSKVKNFVNLKRKKKKELSMIFLKG